MNETELREAMSRYRFYHILELTETVSTPGDPIYLPAQKLCMKYLKSIDLTGKRVLDIGCRDGLFSFAAERMGAAEVVSIDSDVSKAATEFLIPYFNSKIRMHQMNLYDLTPETFGLFDVVIFPGVLYHLRYPFWGLRAIRDILKTGAHLLTETAVWEGDPNNAMLYCPIEGDSPYERTSCTFFNQKGLVDTLTSLGFETLSTEMLPIPTKEAPDNVTFMNRMRNLKYAIKGVFVNQPNPNRGPIGPPPVQSINRGVFHSTYTGFDKDTRLAQYWEATHDLHTGVVS